MANQYVYLHPGEKLFIIHRELGNNDGEAVDVLQYSIEDNSPPIVESYQWLETNEIFNIIGDSDDSLVQAYQKANEFAHKECSYLIEIEKRFAALRPCPEQGTVLDYKTGYWYCEKHDRERKEYVARKAAQKIKDYAEFPVEEAE